MNDEQLRGLFQRLECADTREVAGRELLAVLQKMGRQQRLQSEVLDDAVAVVALRLLEGGAPNAGNLPAYISRMLRNASITALRKRVAGEPAVLDHMGGDASSLDPELGQKALADVFEQLLRRALERRASRYRAELESAARQLLDLAVGHVTMDELLAAEAERSGMPLDSTPTDHKRAVDRLLQRHHRVREALEEARSSLIESGEADARQADLMEMLCARLLRCQKRANRASGGGR